MFQLHKLHDLAFVAMIFHDKRPQGVRKNFRLAFHQNPKLQGRMLLRSRGYFLTNLFMTAGRTNDQLCIGFNSGGNGVVSSGIAGMKRDQHVDSLKRETG